MRDGQAGKMRKASNGTHRDATSTYRNTVGILLADAFRLGLPLLEGVLVLELGPHVDGYLAADKDICQNVRLDLRLFGFAGICRLVEVITSLLMLESDPRVDYGGWGIY